MSLTFYDFVVLRAIYVVPVDILKCTDVFGFELICMSF